MPPTDSPETAPTPTYWVRVTRRRPDGFVEFDFAIDDPSLAVDLILPEPAFRAFCAEHRARHVDAARARALDDEQAKWRYGRPGATG